jgi:hypothetical protein
MQIHENWADIEGTLLDGHPSRTRKGFVDLTIAVEDVHAVESYPNFLTDRAGRTIVVSIPEAVVDAATLVKGARVKVRVRRGQRPDDLFAHTERLSIT